MFYDYMEVEGKMKRLLSVLLALALMVSTATVAFAKQAKEGKFSGIADLDEATVYPGDTIEIDVDYFYGSWKEREKDYDPEKKKDVTVTIEHDNETDPIGYLEKEYHTVSANWTSGAQYIQGVYFNEGDSFVTVEFKSGIFNTVDREIAGTIKIVEKNIPNRSQTVTYTCKIPKGSLTLLAVDEKTQVEEWERGEFHLPDDYQERPVRFTSDQNEYAYGTFIGDFYSEKNGDEVAQFRVRIIDQASLYLGFSEGVNKTLANKYPNADLRFINWTSRPTFDFDGKLSIYMDPDEYIYGVNDDNSLYRLGGTFDTTNNAYVITTKTLRSYVISDTQLNAGGTGGTTTVTPSSSAAPSSTAPSSTAPSSTAPPPPSSSAPVSTAPSSAPEESSSEPEDEEPEDPEDEEPFDPEDEEPEDPDKDEEKEKDKEKTDKKFPLVPVLFGVLGVAIFIGAVVVVGNRNSGSRSRGRRKRYDDDWDD